MNRAKKLCLHNGCREVIAAGESYCGKHKAAHPRFSNLKTQNKPFYNTYTWTVFSKRYRIEHPLCERCKANGFITVSKLVHHKIEVQDLISQGLSPYNSKYLEALCHNCHQQDLAQKNKHIR